MGKCLQIKSIDFIMAPSREEITEQEQSFCFENYLVATAGNIEGLGSTSVQQ
jgi:hypothetical protein